MVSICHFSHMFINILLHLGMLLPRLTQNVNSGIPLEVAVMVKKHEGCLLSFNKCLLSTFCVAGTVLGSEVKQQTGEVRTPPSEITFQWWRFSAQPTVWVTFDQTLLMVLLCVCLGLGLFHLYSFCAPSPFSSSLPPPPNLPSYIAISLCLLKSYNSSRQVVPSPSHSSHDPVFYVRWALLIQSTCNLFLNQVPLHSVLQCYFLGKSLLSPRDWHQGLFFYPCTVPCKTQMLTNCAYNLSLITLLGCLLFQQIQLWISQLCKHSFYFLIFPTGPWAWTQPPLFVPLVSLRSTNPSLIGKLRPVLALSNLDQSWTLLGDSMHICYKLAMSETDLGQRPRYAAGKL